ncbi:putative gustatory receptor 2a [Nilaparvata lugens]|uniref:putative gustatory receptor 2a n=1 Tax=Nilaparvata lugens TaxID=108931 RepID=UPI00193E43F5|nr:putative gustatory receptor 2a [Nilaparvata lugens]
MPPIITPIEEIPTHRESGFETDRKLNVEDNTRRIPLKFHTKLLLLLNSCFGVMTYDEDLIQNHLNNLPFKFYCKCSQVISSILITTYGAKLYQSTGEIYTMEDNPSIVGIAVSYFRIISIINFLVTSSLKSLERWQEYVEVIEKIKQLNTRLDVRFVRSGQRGAIIMIGIYVMTNGIHKLFSVLKKPDEFFLIPIGNMMVFILIVFELNLRKLVLHLCTMFDAINTSLEHFGKERFINYNHNVYSHLGGKHKQNLSITQLSDLHRELCGVIQDVSNAFGGQNISLMFFLVFYITFCPYKIFICFLKPTEDWEYMENIVILVCWCTTYIAMLFILILPCSSATSKANKTATIVSKILTMKNMSPHNYSEMEKFSRQLLHHNTEFTVMDMFTLNLSLVTTIAGSVTTYLVILIQFEDTFF